MKPKVANILLILSSYLVLLVSFYFVIFTYSSTMALVLSTLLCSGILYFYTKRKPGVFGKVLMVLPLFFGMVFLIIDLKHRLSSRSEAEKISVGGMERRFRYYAPSSLDQSSGTAVIIALHGFMQTARGMERLTGFNDLADEFDFLVIYPEGYKKSWNDGDNTKAATRENIDDISFIAVLIDWARDQYQAEKVLLTGFSNGGFLAVDAGCQLTEMIDAVVPVAAGVWEGNLRHCTDGISHDMLFVQSRQDPMTSFTRFGPSIVDYALKAGCSHQAILMEDNTEQGWMLKEYSCGKRRLMHLVVSKGGHIWPGGPQYLPAFLVGKTVNEPDISRLLVEWFIVKKK